MEILTITQIAILLNVKKSWVYARTGDGKLIGSGLGRKPSRKARYGHQKRAQAPPEIIPHYKIGKLLRFNRNEVLAWFEKHHLGDVQTPGVQPEGAAQANETKHLN